MCRRREAGSKKQVTSNRRQEASSKEMKTHSMETESFSRHRSATWFPVTCFLLLVSSFLLSVSFLLLGSLHLLLLVSLKIGGSHWRGGGPEGTSIRFLP